MPRLTDLIKVRSLLDRDRAWTAYAIGDLAPGLVEHSEWYAPADGSPALVLVYRGFDPPIVFTFGSATDLAPLIGELTMPAISLQIRPDAVDAIATVYPSLTIKPMLRMVLAPALFRPVAPDGVRPVGEDDLAAVTALYRHGCDRGDGPDFFTPAMLGQRTFYGVWEGDALVSVAGTHLYSRDLGVCAVGNVYTRADRRGRGLGARVTAAVVAHAVVDGVGTIVLNVGRDNSAAQRVYKRLGFRVHCDFVEGEARRAGA